MRAVALSAISRGTRKALAVNASAVVVNRVSNCMLIGVLEMIPSMLKLMVDVKKKE